MTYIIGDVHGKFDSLLCLMNLLTNISRVIFVGDLIDKGEKSKDVINFIRKNNYESVLGNHEDLMLKYLLCNIPEQTNKYYKQWINRGGLKTLISYGLIKFSKQKPYVIKDKAILRVFKNDLNWMKNLPLFIKLDNKRNGMPIVISHAFIGDIWHKKDSDEFRRNVLYNRKLPNKNVQIFNIFGHTPTTKIDLDSYFLCVDTGCCYNINGYGKLSAYCVEEHKIISYP